MKSSGSCWKKYNVVSGQINDIGPQSRDSTLNVLAWRVGKDSNSLFVCLFARSTDLNEVEMTWLSYIIEEDIQKLKEIRMLEWIYFVTTVYSTVSFQKQHFLTWLWKINLWGEALKSLKCPVIAYLHRSEIRVGTPTIKPVSLM